MSVQSLGRQGHGWMWPKLLLKVKFNYYMKMSGIIILHLDSSWELNYILLVVLFCSLFSLFDLVFCYVYLCLVILNCVTERGNEFQYWAAMFLTVSTTATIMRISYIMLYLWFRMFPKCFTILNFRLGLVQLFLNNLLLRSNKQYP